MCPLMVSKPELNQVGEDFESMIPNQLIFLTGIVGEVLAAFKRDGLSVPRFDMPG